MASATLTLSMGPQDHPIASGDITNNYANVSAPNIVGNNANPKSSENMQCFVCDAKIQGRHYALATCKTQTSRSRVIEKLGELVGERYMVVISEDDVICRSCANLINTLDRLETEMCNVRDNVLRFLEQKYSLQEGELLANNEKLKPSQPPQITKCNNQNSGAQGTKRDANVSSRTVEKSRSKRNNTWMQCDKCQYTTHQNSFMVHHIRDHIKQKMFCDNCGVQFHNNQIPHNCNSKNQSKNQDLVQGLKQDLSPKDISKTLGSVPILEQTMQQSIPIMSIPSYSESQLSDHRENIPLISLSNSEGLQIQNILATDDISPSSQQVYVRVLQPIDVNEETAHSTMMAPSNTDTELLVKIKDNSGKQILTLTEDGNLEMVDMACWNDLQSSESHSSITFQ